MDKIKYISADNLKRYHVNIVDKFKNTYLSISDYENDGISLKETLDNKVDKSEFDKLQTKYNNLVSVLNKILGVDFNEDFNSDFSKDISL